MDLKTLFKEIETSRFEIVAYSGEQKTSFCDLEGNVVYQKYFDDIKSACIYASLLAICGDENNYLISHYHVVINSLNVGYMMNITTSEKSIFCIKQQK